MEDKLNFKKMRLIFNKSLSKEKQQSIEKNLQNLYSKEIKIFKTKKIIKEIKVIKAHSFNIIPIRRNSAVYVKEKPIQYSLFKNDDDKYAINSFMITELPKQDNLLPVLVNRLTVLENKVNIIEDLFNRSYNNNLEELSRKIKSASKNKDDSNKSLDNLVLPISNKKTSQSNKQLVRLIKPPLLPRQRRNTYMANSTCVTDKNEESVNSSFNRFVDKISNFEKISFKEKLNSLKDKTKNMLSMYEENSKKLLEEVRKERNDK
jgi:hypothetical protein